MSTREAVFLEGLDARVREILDHCSACGRCVEVCPTAEPGGVDRSDPRAVVTDVLAILRGEGDPTSAGARWAETCTGSGRCLTACEDGVNPRFMLAMTRVALNQAKAEADRHAAGQKGFHTMSQGVKVLSRLQLPADLVARVTRSAHASDGPPPDVVLYLGCNVMRTPHIALLCMDVLDRIGARYAVFGGPANCCGVIQFRAGDIKTAGKVGGNTVAGFAATGAAKVLTWCPTCNIQLGEVVMPTTSSPFGLDHVVPYIAARLDQLRPHFVNRVEKRVALHEHPGVRGVTEGVLQILGAIPASATCATRWRRCPRTSARCTRRSSRPPRQRAWTRWSASTMPAIASCARTRARTRSRS
jgi:heterodisulfide reductase subunit D